MKAIYKDYISLIQDAYNEGVLSYETIDYEEDSWINLLKETDGKIWRIQYFETESIASELYANYVDLTEGGSFYETNFASGEDAVWESYEDTIMMRSTVGKSPNIMTVNLAERMVVIFADKKYYQQKSYKKSKKNCKKKHLRIIRDVI